ncbi:DUF4296 domain-containing protein [Flavitalea antarctica]
MKISHQLIILSLFLCLCIACTNKSKVPSGVLPQARMEKVLWDMMLADRFAAQFIMKDSARIDETEETFKVYAQVFSLNNITRDEFIKSYKFYMTRPDLSKVMMDTLLRRADRLKEEMYRPKLANPPDSMPSAASAAEDSVK